MTEIQQFNPSAGQLAEQIPGAPSSAVASLASWAQELDAAYQLATMVCQTAFAPAHFRDKPEEAATAMLYGHTLGLPPMVSIKSIYVVHGTPALYAKTMYAIALAAGHQIERVHATERGVKFRARRKGATQWQEVEWTIDRARTAGYTSNKKYQTDPIGMLTAKCMAEAANLVAAEALAGMASVEEVQLGDYDDVTVEEVQTPTPAPKAKTTTVKRKAPAKAPEPTPPPAIEDAPAVAVDHQEQEDEPEAPAPSTRSQWIRLGNALDAVGITDKADKTEAMRSWAKDQGIEVDITSAKDLTADQVEALIVELEADPDAAEAAGWDTQEVPS